MISQRHKRTDSIHIKTRTVVTGTWQKKSCQWLLLRVEGK